MRRYIIIWTLLFVTIALNSETLQLRKLSQTEYKVDFNVPEYETKAVFNEGILANKLSILGSDKDNWNENLNGLPQSEQWVYVPDGYKAEIELQNPVIIRKQNVNCDTDESIRTGQDWLDSSQPMRFRGNTLVSFVVKPFAYNQATRELSILSSAKIGIRFVADPTYIYRNTENLQTPTTVQMLKALCINRDDIRISNQKPGSYVILYNGTSNETIIQTLADWKRQKGFDVRMVNTALIGNNTDDIKSYLQNGYDTWPNPPEFIFILGEPIGAANVPTFAEFYHFTTVGDYRYTLLDGTLDLVPDAYVGRATFSSATELQTIINKIVYYEKYQNQATNDWANRSLLVGDPNNSGPSCITTINYIKGLILNMNPDVAFNEVTSGIFPNQISSAINNGVGTYWYRGHGDLSGWTNNDVSLLNNYGKYPFLSYITCFTGTFADPQVSQAELFLKAGSAISPRGAIAVVGASCETHTCTNNIMTGGIAHGFYVDQLAKAGPAMVRGKLALLANFPQNPAGYLNEYMQAINLLGDPAVDIWLKPPTNITVSYPQVLYQAGGLAQICVLDSDGEPVPNAWVTILKGTSELFATGFTNEAGLIILPYAALTTGNVKLTVTKPDYRTFQTNIAVSTNPAQVTLNPIPALSQCNAGSTKTFPVSITNYNTNLIGVTGVLSTLDEDITITQDSVAFGNVDAGATAVSVQNFTFVLASSIPKGKTIYFNLHLTHSTGSIDLPIMCIENGANLTIATANFGNDLLIHGNNLLSISLHNESTTLVSGLSAILESTHPLVTISNPQPIPNTIPGGATVSFPASFSVTVSDSLPEGVVVTLYLEIQNANGFHQRLSISKAVGTQSVNDVTGPDDYGYICYGPGDANYQAYNWVEIDPVLGGTGTNLNLNDTNAEGSGAFGVVNLPFQFRYYGVVYSQITVCSNGYIMPGNVGSVEWMNWQIPGAMCPKPIIAPFWDDLLTDNSGRILYKYDASLHAFVVQWHNMINRYSGVERETFQALLYDPLYVSSPTGDSPILFQYKLFNNIDMGNYGGDFVDHGQYASIGIGDHTGLSGVEYSFNNTYPATAATLGNNTTLYFTTMPNYITEPHPIIVNSQITEVGGNGNGMIDAGELIDLGVIIRNTGMGSLNEATATLSSSDPYVIVVQSQATLASLFTYQMATTAPLFRIQFSQECPNLHTATFNLTIQNQIYTFPLTFNLSVHALNITMSDLRFTDNNDNFPAQGETVNMSFHLTNESLLDAQNVSVTMIPPEGVSVSPLTQVISLAAQAQQTLSYVVNIGANVEQGSQIVIGLNLYIQGMYNQQLNVSFMVGTPNTLFSSDFEEDNPLSKWAAVQNVLVDPSQYINPTGNEAIMIFYNGNPNSYLLSNLVSANDIQGGLISFKYFNLNPDVNLSLQVSYDFTQTFQILWQTAGTNTGPEEVILPLENIPPNTTAISYWFLASRGGQSPQPLVLDDIKIIAVHHAPGIVTGQITLDMYPERVNQAEVQVLFTDNVTHPNAQGEYQVPAYAGWNAITVSLDGYTQGQQPAIVNVESGQMNAAPEIYMRRICAPINLTHSLTGNVLTLNWDLEGDTLANNGSKADKVNSRNTRFLTPNYYKIWLKRNSFTLHDTCSVQTYTKVMNLPGLYRIYVQAVYIFTDGLETFSDSSNVLFVAVTSDEDNIEKPVLSLLQNEPNPFNQNTTINFTVPTKHATSLVIYNVKGQEVATLFNGESKAGNQTVVWNGKDKQNNPVGSGIYYYRLKTGKHELTRKMILLK